MPIWIWMMIALGLVVVEVNTGTFYFLFLALAAALAGLSALVVPASLPIQLAVFGLATLLSLPFVHRLVEHLSRHAPDVKVGPERLIGERGTVTEAIDPATGKGMVKVAGEVWRAFSDEHIDVGRNVLVEEVKGNKLFVYREPVLDEERLSSRLRAEEEIGRRLEISEAPPTEDSQP